MKNQDTSLTLELIDKYRKLRFMGSSWAVEQKLLPGSQQYQKFIVLTQARSGSNLLGDLLGSSSQIALSGEIFGNLSKRIIWNFWQPEKYTSSKILTLRQDEPIKFLEEVVFRPYPAHVKAVGFKLFYSQARSSSHQVVWNYLKSNPDIKIIHLTRRNLLKGYLSKQLAFQNKNFIQRRQFFGSSKLAPVRNPVLLTYENCTTEFEKVVSWQQQARLFFKDHAVKEVVYEDFVKNQGSALKDVQLFLETRPERLRTSIIRQSNMSLEDSIENYWELKEKFSATPWASFFTV